jgi:hypothetical protein
MQAQPARPTRFRRLRWEGGRVAAARRVSVAGIGAVVGGGGSQRGRVVQHELASLEDEQARRAARLA